MGLKVAPRVAVTLRWRLCFPDHQQGDRVWDSVCLGRTVILRVSDGGWQCRVVGPDILSVRCMSPGLPGAWCAGGPLSPLGGRKGDGWDVGAHVHVCL